MLKRLLKVSNQRDLPTDIERQLDEAHGGLAQG